MYEDIPDFIVLEDDEPDVMEEEPFAAPERNKVQVKRKKDYESRSPRSPRVAPAAGASWMQRNAAFEGDKKPARNFREDFRGTRVFVQNLHSETKWQDLKDHFREAGEVIFASVSAHPDGTSKGCGVVQYETTEMAATAIEIMRNHPLHGQTLYVRPDVQEEKAPHVKGPTPPTKWKCANEDNMYVDDDERKEIQSIIKARDYARRNKQYHESDALREQLLQEHGVRVDDRLKLWWTSVDGNQVPNAVAEGKGPGRWGKPADWRQIPTTPENDACVDADMVEGLLKQRDVARREKDFATADHLLEQAKNCGDLPLRIHDESRTWRVWTELPPTVAPRKSPAEKCIDIVMKHEPTKVEEIRNMLEKFPGREYQFLKKLKERYE